MVVPENVWFVSKSQQWIAVPWRYFAFAGCFHFQFVHLFAFDPTKWNIIVLCLYVFLVLLLPHSNVHWDICLLTNQTKDSTAKENPKEKTDKTQRRTHKCLGFCWNGKWFLCYKLDNYDLGRSETLEKKQRKKKHTSNLFKVQIDWANFVAIIEVSESIITMFRLMNVFPTRCVLWNRVQLSNIIIALRSNALFADGLQLKHESGLANACVPMLVTAIATAFQLKALRLHWTIRPIGANGKSISQKAPSQYSNEAHFFSTMLIVFCVCVYTLQSLHHS